MIIRSYGVHWRSDRVSWGTQGVKGTLLGAASRSKAAKAVDFGDQRGLYALYADYELVYVGQTSSGDDRLLGYAKSATSTLPCHWEAARGIRRAVIRQRRPATAQRPSRTSRVLDSLDH